MLHTRLATRRYLLSGYKDETAYLEMYVRINPEHILCTEKSDSEGVSSRIPLFVVGKRPSNVPFLIEVFDRAKSNLLELGATFFQCSYKYTNSPVIRFLPDSLDTDAVIFDISKCNVIESVPCPTIFANGISQVSLLFDEAQFHGGLFRVRFKLYGNAKQGVITLSAVSFQLMFNA